MLFFRVFKFFIALFSGSTDDLPDSLAIGTAMFSKMGENERRKLVKDRFKIELDDSELERLKEMSTLGQDKYDHGRADERDEWVDAMAKSIVSVVTETGMPVDEAFSTFHMPEQGRSQVEAEVRRRLG